MEELYHDQKLMQFINPRVATSGLDIHVSYYDTDTKALKYAHQRSGSTSPVENYGWISIDGGYDAHDEGTGTSTNIPGSGTTLRTVSAVYATVGEFVSIGQDLLLQSNGAVITATVSGRLDFILAVGASVRNTITAATITNVDRVVDKGGASRTAAAGEFSAIDTNPSGYPVIAYYDITRQTVRIARASATIPFATQWLLQDVLDNETVITPWKDPNYRYSGKYITMKIDAAGYVHLAFYRNSTGDLIYMKSTNNPTTGATPYTFGPSVIVDSIGSVGVWADLAILEPTPGATTEDDARPYISYLDSSLANTFDGIKVAYWNPALERASDTLVSGGTDSASQPDSPDGWELMNAPMGFEVEGSRTSVEFNTVSTDYSVTIAYASTDYFRIGYYVKE
jgi:hypothetical protein